MRQYESDIRLSKSSRKTQAMTSILISIMKILSPFKLISMKRGGIKLQFYHKLSTLFKILSTFNEYTYIILLHNIM